MAAESKRLKLMEESTRNIDPPSKYTPSTMFSPSDVILVVEGFKLHVHKQLLTDNSPVFKRMLESDFKEKHQKEIPLPGKRIKDFEEFLWTLYQPGYRPITKDNVFKILPLADEYQASTIMNMCESFIIQSLQQVTSRRIEHPDMRTLLNYVSSVEKYNLSAALPHVVHLCAKHSFESLTQAAEEIPISKEMLSQICIERTKMTDTLTKQKMEKGEFNTVLETLDLNLGMHNEDRRGFMKKYEDQLVKACDERKITKSILLEFIIAGEQYNLQNLLLAAIKLSAQCKESIYELRYKDVSNDTKVKMLTARLNHIHWYGTSNDAELN